MKRLTREQLYLMSSAKAKAAAASDLLVGAARDAVVVAPDGDPAVKLRAAVEAADEALKAVFAALENQLS